MANPFEEINNVFSDPDANELLSLRFKNFHRLNEQTEIDTSFISCAEYQLFLNDEADAGNTHSPDHWVTMHYPHGQGYLPIAGIRYSDASIFCKWLTKVYQKKYDPGFHFRLPTISEAEKKPFL